ncbi:acetyl-CoA synthetase-like protein [Wallemia mellicola]|nr:acetyl-CoA synthetase-like protein [Wallemia mellicola]
MNTFEAARSDNWTIPSLIKHHFEHNREHVFFEDTEGHQYKGLEVHKAVYRAAAYLQEQLNHKNDQTIGFYLENECLTYSTMLKGAVVSGNQMLALSNRNSVPALAHLIKSTDTHNLLYGDTSIQLTNNAMEVKSILTKEGFEVNLIKAPPVSLLFPEVSDKEFDAHLDPLPAKFEDDKKSPIILHSSGSSGSFPKPIYLSNETIRSWALSHDNSNAQDILSLQGKKFYSGALPTFHAMGFYSQVISSLSSTVTIAIPKVSLPPPFPTPESIIENIKRTNSDIAIVVPSIIEKWAEDASTVEFLKTLKLLLFGGAGLSSNIGNMLTAEGVRLLSVYGTTETGPSCSCFTIRNSENSNEWGYSILSSNHNARFIDQGDVNNLDDALGYNTGDLVERHPYKKDLFKIVGRSDSQIILASGEKTNPEPIERLIDSNPLVSRSLMFGRHRTSNGIIIEPSFSISNSEDFLDSIWPSIEAANDHAPQHSRLQRSLVLIATEPFPLTPKGSVKRNATLEMFQDEIEAAYNKADEAVAESVPFDISNVRASVSNIVNSVMGQSLEDVDLVSQGLDSMQATIIRNKLTSALKAFKDVNLNATIVFQHPKITLLSEYVDQILNDDKKELSEEELVDMKAAEINATIDRHCDTIKAKVSNKWEEPARECNKVLVTGTTGGLGAQLLVTLIRDATVDHVYAVNRSNAINSLKERQIKALAEKGIPASEIVNSTKLTLIEADLTLPDLGLEEKQYREIEEEVDVIIHNAWRVDFNVALQSFEPDIKGVVNLTNLAITSKHGAAVLFTSSIGSVSRWPVGRETVEEPLTDARMAVGMGYGESKFVGERILSYASSKIGLPTTVLRIGQLCGDREVGYWTSSNWVPAIIKSGVSLHCLPTGDDIITWISLDDAAKAIVDFSHNRRSSKIHDLLHVVHPRPRSWNDIFKVVVNALNKKGIEVSLVDYQTWLSKLKSEDNSKMVENPAIKLLPMFESGEVSNTRREFVEAMGNPILQTVRSQEASATMRSCKELSDGDVLKNSTKESVRTFLSALEEYDDLANAISQLGPFYDSRESWSDEQLRDEILSATKYSISRRSLNSLETVQSVIFNYIKPFFTAQQKKINENTGRVRIRELASEHVDTLDEPAWKTQTFGIWGTLLLLMDVTDVSKSWFMFLPPTMSLLDDHEPYYKTRGVRLARKLIDSLDNKTIHQAGLRSLWEESLYIALTFFAQDHGPELLVSTVEALLALYRKTTVDVDTLYKLTMEGIIQPWFYSGDKLDVLLPTFTVLPHLLLTMDVNSVRFLKVIIPKINEVLIMVSPPTEHSLPVQVAALDALSTLIRISEDLSMLTRIHPSLKQLDADFS